LLAIALDEGLIKARSRGIHGGAGVAMKPHDFGETPGEVSKTLKLPLITLTIFNQGLTRIDTDFLME
jgi:hypothetical protein